MDIEVVLQPSVVIVVVAAPSNNETSPLVAEGFTLQAIRLEGLGSNEPTTKQPTMTKAPEPPTMLNLW